TIMNGGRLDNDQLVLRPFPQSQSGERSLPELWTEYRRNMLAHAGVALFLFGNKLDRSGAVVPSSGMREEFDIAVANGLFVIPVGITGSISADLWKELIITYDESKHDQGKKITPLLHELGTQGSDLERAHDIILSLLPLI
ncbi:TPA: hypothetical protein ACPT1G_005261, partial [Escherichia coli]